MMAGVIPPHVVHVIDELPPDGAERLLADMLRHRSNRFRFSVLCLMKGGALEQEIRDMGVPVTVLGRRGKVDLGFIFRIARWFRQERVDVVHTHLFTADSFGRVAARLAGVRAVFSTAHNTVVCEGKTRKAVHRALSWISTRVIACSEEVGRVMREEDHLRASRLVVISNGINVDRLAGARGEGVRAEFSVPEKELLIGVIGRLHPAKGHSDLFAALARLRKDGLKPTCLVIGSGNSRDELEAESKKLGLTDQVVFTGQRSDVPRLLAGLDILAMPSRWEGLPIALLEAMAMSRPIVATRVSGIPDVIHDGDSGLLVPPSAPEALAEALRRLLTDPALRERLGKRAYTTMRERFDVARTAKAYEGLYAAALGLPAESPPASEK
jgi:glycosyltransferase involved in cell wall biosynthesis